MSARTDKLNAFTALEHALEIMSNYYGRNSEEFLGYEKECYELLIEGSSYWRKELEAAGYTIENGWQKSGE